MKIKAKKSGKWAVDGEPARPQVAMIDGREYTEKQIPADMMEMLVDKGFASWVDGPEADDDNPGDGDGIRATLQAIADGAEGKREAKDLLEKWGMDNLTYDVDKSKSLEDVIDILVAEHGNQE